MKAMIGPLFVQVTSELKVPRVNSFWKAHARVTLGESGIENLVSSISEIPNYPGSIAPSLIAEPSI
jgi:hypothetical protein